jgi:hypothetical protein
MQWKRTPLHFALVGMLFVSGSAYASTLCGENQHVESATCKDCPWNTERPAGDDVDAGNTYCTCPAGYYVTRYGDWRNPSWCNACPDNSYSDATPNFDEGSYMTSCYCNENFRAVAMPIIGMGWCEACPSGMSNAAGDRICYKRDNSCYDGHATTYCDGGVICDENEYVTSSYTCAACPSHSTNPAGDDTAKGPTLCGCDRNYRVSGNACVSCDAG